MKENTKKWLVIMGLAIVCVLLVFGISSVIYKEPVQVLPEESKIAEDTELIIDGGEVSKEPEADRAKDTTEKDGLTIDIPKETEQIESGQQEIQKEPEKTEDEKPQSPPEVTEDTDIENPNTTPAYKAPEESTPAADDNPQTGSSKDGMVYVEGFGWLPDEGAGTGINADNMYENGNKVGIMD